MVTSGQEPRIPRIPRIDAVVETLLAMSLPPNPPLPTESWRTLLVNTISCPALCVFAPLREALPGLYHQSPGVERGSGVGILRAIPTLAKKLYQ
jgi:hypothetical protein